MPRTLLIAVLAVAAGCARANSSGRAPPADGFQYPSGIVHVVDPAIGGVLYVASSNFERRYDYGTLSALRLSNVDGFPAGISASPSTVADLPLPSFDPGTTQVRIQTFAGEMAAAPVRMGNGAIRLFTPTRAERSEVMVVNAGGDGAPADALSCHYDPSSRDCRRRAPSLVANEDARDEVAHIRAPQPFGVGVGVPGLAPGGQMALDDVFIAHVAAADYPRETGTNLLGYSVHFSAIAPPTADEIVNGAFFTEMGEDRSNSVAVGKLFAYIAGRGSLNPRAELLRVVRRDARAVFPIDLQDFYRQRMENPAACLPPEQLRPWISRGIQNLYGAAEARGIALDSTERWLFLIGRSPDVLLVLRLENTEDQSECGTTGPSMVLTGAVPLPPGANQVKVIERGGGLAPLAVVTCNNMPTGTKSERDRGVIVIYDDEVGQLVAKVEVGAQPFGLAVQTESLPPGTARIFVSNFGDGRIAVLDMPDLRDPQKVWLVAHLGKVQCTIDTEPCEDDT